MNTDIPGHYHIRYALTKIKGIGVNLSHAICARYDLDEELPISKMGEVKVKELESNIKNLKKVDSWMFNRRKDYESGEDVHIFTTDLKFRKDFDVKRMQKVRSYKGIRHAAGLPVRGQRTKAHFRKGRAVGVSKKKAVTGGKK